MPPGPLATLGAVALAALGGAGLQAGLCRGAALAWPALARPRAGEEAWCAAAPVLAGALAVACTSLARREDRVATAWAVAALPAFVAALALAGGVAGVAEHVRYVSQTEAVPYLLGDLARQAAPAALLAALPAAPWAIALLRRTPVDVLAAALSLALTASGLALLGVRAGLLDAAARPGADLAGLAAAFPPLVWVAAPAAAGLGIAALVARRGARRAALAWGLAWLPVLDPTARALARALPGSGVAFADPAALPRLAAVRSGAPGTIVDLTGGALRVDGAWEPAGLDAALASRGFADMGPDFPRPTGSTVAWHRALRRGLVIAPPPGATVGGFAPVIRQAARRGVTLWFWPGRFDPPLTGPLATAASPPVLPVLLDDPALGSDTGPVRIPVDADPPAGSVVLAPDPAMPLADLFPVVERLAARHAVGVLFPGMPGGAPP